MKRYWDLHYPGDVSQFATNNAIPAAAPRVASPKKPASPRTATAPPKRSSTGLSGAPVRTAAPVVLNPAPTPARKENTAPTPSPVPVANHQVVAPVTSTTSTDISATKHREQTLLIAELRVTAEGLEKERDFYFKKLREIETLCESADEASQPFVKKIQAVLYATDDIPSTDV
jgi:microtubule-associated protein, RP/EB family